ncbi:MAG: DUF1559 domain-containing protein [Planctomycetia bacterium]|nr:DUF1559 domain-containing protein [Planctomycetia bacterium]
MRQTAGCPPFERPAAYRRLPASARTGFTLIEVLIVIAIIGLLISLSIPAIQAARERARSTQCQNNLRQFGLALANCESQRGAFPSGMTVRVTGPLGGDSQWQFHGYMSELLPFLDAAAVAANYHTEGMFCDPANAAAIGADLGVTVCPSAPPRDPQPNAYQPSLAFPKSYRQHKIIAPILGKLDAKYSAKYTGAVTDYTVITGVEDGTARTFGYDVPRDDPAGLRGMFPSPFAVESKALVNKVTPAILGPVTVEFSVRLRASDITDGLSNTIAMTEVAGRPEHWENGVRTMRNEPLESAWADPQTVADISGRDTPAGKCLMQCDNAGEIYSFHPAEINFAFADGHVTGLSRQTDPNVLLALVTPDRGEGN